MPNYKLLYFNGRGRAETIRMVFAAAGQKFEDNRIEFADWPAKKKQLRFGQVPLLHIDDQELNQSVAIIHYLGQQFGLAGKTPLDAAKCHALLENFRDFWTQFSRRVMSEKDQEKRPQIVKDAAEEVKTGLATFETLAKEANGFLVAGQLTYADLEAHNVLFMFTSWYGEDFLKAFPHLHKHYELVGKQPKVSEYLASRPKTLM